MYSSAPTEWLKKKSVDTVSSSAAKVSPNTYTTKEQQPTPPYNERVSI